MAPKNPLGRLADTAISTLKNPLDTAGKVVEQARGTAALGRMVTEQVAKTAVSQAADTAGAVVRRATGRPPAKTETYAPRTDMTEAKLRPVPDVNEPAHTPAENKGVPKQAQKSAAPAAKKSAPPAKKSAPPAKKAAPAAKKAAAKKAPAKKVSATPADVAEVVESAVAEDPKKTAATKAATPAKKAAAKKAATKKAPAKKASATKGAAKKSSPGDKLPKKATGKGNDPKSAEQLQNLEGSDLLDTPTGTAAAGPGRNPDTTDKELHQPGTEGIVEESTAKAVASKTDTLRKAADTDKK